MPDEKSSWPFVATAAIYLALLGLVLHQSLAGTGGHLIYALDDPYIHLATAKNLVNHGVWGVTPYEFSSSTSSIWWPLLLAGTFLVCGVRQTMPFALNLLFCLGLLYFFHRVLRRHGFKALTQIVVLLALVIFGPLVTLTFQGQEHVMHMLAAAALAYLASLVLSGAGGRRAVVAMMALGPLVNGVRFEGLFMTFVVWLLLAGRKKWKLALIFGPLAVAPVVIFGLFSWSQGGMFLPNSVLLKGRLTEIHGIGAAVKFILYSAYYEMIKEPSQLMLLLAALMVLVRRLGRPRPWEETPTYLLLIYLATAFLHMQFARSGVYFRYEAYLLALALLGLTLAAPGLLPPDFRVLDLRRPARTAAVLVLLLFAGVPLVRRATGSLFNTARYTRNIYQQQYQMGRFVKEYYQGRGVVANDIGAITFLAEPRLIDVVGLGSNEIARLRLSGRFNRKVFLNYAAEHDGCIAMVYEGNIKFLEILPPEWVEVGQWRIPDHEACASDTVHIFSLVPGQREALMHNLRDFSSRLPAEVIESGSYLDTPAPVSPSRDRRGDD